MPLSGPPGTISGQIYLPSRIDPQRLAVYAISTYADDSFDIRYVMTEVDPPARTYKLSVPPGQYQVVARLDADPQSAAGYLQCASYSCSPVMTRAGNITCRSLDCQPYLPYVYVRPGESLTQIDVGGWGSLYALDRLWSVDEFGAPGPVTYEPPTPGVTPSAGPQPPSRELPPPSTAALPSAFEIDSRYDPKVMVARVLLPAGWSEVPNPARAVQESVRRDFSTQTVRSPLSLTGDGVWLTMEIAGACTAPPHPDATAQATLGSATLYFESPHSRVGVQPYSGYSVLALKRGKYCLALRFTVAGEETREADLPAFLGIIQQAV